MGIEFMKILIANNTLSILGGSETYYLTLAKELKKQGHNVHGYSPLLGIIARKMRENGIECYSGLPNKNYDAIIASHYHIVDSLREAYPDTPIISVIHSPLHIVDKFKKTWGLEHPAINSRVEQYVAVSEETQEKLKDDYNINAKVIRNFFEIKEYPINNKPKQILFNSNYTQKKDDYFKTIVKVANHYKAGLLAIGEGFFQTPNVKEAVKQSDIVVGIGRSVLEGVAMGRIGVIHGRWGTGGVISPKSYKELREANFSGRNNQGKWMTAEEIVAEIDKHYQDTKWRLDYMRENHNVKKAAKTFIDLCNYLVSQKSAVKS